MNSRSLTLLGLIMTCVACGDASPISEEMTTESNETMTEEADSETYSLSSTTGIWVNVGVTFGPCPVLPSVCTVGDFTPAHSGPGYEGGCFNYECREVGTWVATEPTFGPCPALTSVCVVGDVMPAHTGPGNAGGCYIHECVSSSGY